MRLTRTALAVLAVALLASCGRDVTSPERPLFNGGYVGSGMRTDSTTTKTPAPSSTTTDDGDSSRNGGYVGSGM